jgi:hypothetical protein
MHHWHITSFSHFGILMHGSVVLQAFKLEQMSELAISALGSVARKQIRHDHPRRVTKTEKKVYAFLQVYFLNMNERALILADFLASKCAKETNMNDLLKITCTSSVYSIQTSNVGEEFADSAFNACSLVHSYLHLSIAGTRKCLSIDRFFSQFRSFEVSTTFSISYSFHWSCYFLKHAGMASSCIFHSKDRSQ